MRIVPSDATVLNAVAAWLIIGVLIVLLLLAVWRRSEPLTSAQGIVIILASLLVALAGGMTATLLTGVVTIEPFPFDDEDIRMLVIVIRGAATALYLGALFDIVGWKPSIARFIRI